MSLLELDLYALRRPPYTTQRGYGQALSVLDSRRSYSRKPVTYAHETVQVGSACAQERRQQ